MEVKINLSSEDIPYIIRLALAGCSELLNYPKLCSLVNEDWEPDRSEYDHRRWAWYRKATPVHALAFNGHSKILDYPQYLTLKNEDGDTPLHFLAQSCLPRGWNDEIVVTPEIAEVFDKILKIKDLDKNTGYEGVTPLHFIAQMGYLPVLDYPGIEKIETPGWNAQGTPMTFLYESATTGLGKLLRHPHIFTEYESHGSPLESLAHNKELRPTVKILKRYGFKFNRKWHPSKKLDREVVSDMLSIPKSIRFMIY